jgi:hypothetical protein
MPKDAKIFLAFVAVFLAAYFIPFGRPNVQGAFAEAFALLQEYARRHVLLCLIPAFFIAGAITVFIRQESVVKHLGPKSNKVLAYGIASVSGTILAVCSCTVLPLFAGIYTRGAGIGPASSSTAKSTRPAASPAWRKSSGTSRKRSEGSGRKETSDDPRKSKTQNSRPVPDGLDFLGVGRRRRVGIFRPGGRRVH